MHRKNRQAHAIGRFYGIASAVVFAASIGHAGDAREAKSISDRGQLIASGGGPIGPDQACFTCHGIAGTGERASGIPRLAGLPAPYLAKQLDDYTTGARESAIMTPIAGKLTPNDRKAVSSYYAALRPHDPPRGFSASGFGASDPALMQDGAALYAMGAPTRGVQACINCHGPAGRGLGFVYPPLAGQPPLYTIDQLRHWRSGERRNSVASVMQHIAQRMNDQDIRAVAAYLGSLLPEVRYK